MVAPFLNAYTSDTTAKAWDVSNNAGTIGGTPSGWDAPGFDDSGWAYAANVGTYDYFAGTDFIDNIGTPVSPSQYVGSAELLVSDRLTSVSNGYAQDLVTLVRMTFNLLDLPTAADLIVNSDNSAIFKLNGTSITSLGGSAIDPAPFVVGLNVLTATVTNGNSPPSWFGGNPMMGIARLYSDVEVWDGTLAAGFSGTPLTGSRPLAVQFTDETLGLPTSWEWDFGDSTVSTEQNPLHIYADPGAYTVTLIARNATESDTETKVAYVVVSLPTASSATAAPGPGWWVDWANDGFNAGGTGLSELARMLPEPTSADDNITSRVKKVSWTRGGQADLIGGQTVGTCIITVNNTDGAFNPDNTASPYYSLLRPGRKVWGGAQRSTGTIKGLWAGFLKEVVPIPGPAKEAQLVCHDIFGVWAQARAQVAFSTARTARSFREAILTALELDSTQWLLADEPYSLAVSGADERNGVAVLDRLNAATGTRHWVIPADDKGDHFFYRSVNRNQILGLETPATTMTENDVTGMSGLRYTTETIINRQRVSHHRFTFSAFTDVWVLTDVPLTLAAHEVRTILASFSGWVSDPAIASVGTGGTQTLTNYGKSARIRLVGPGTWTALKLTGKLGVEVGTTVEEAQDFASRAAYDIDREGNPADTDYIAESSQALALAQAVVARGAVPRYRPQVSMRNRFDKSLTFDMGDVITQSIAELDMTRRFEIVGVAGSISEGGKVWDFTWTYLETLFQTTLALFKLDSSALDGPDLLGF